MSVHTITDIRKARALREQHGWPYTKIAEALGVSKSTARYWCDPSARRDRRDRYRRQAGARRGGKKIPSPEFLIARAQLLREAHISARAIAALFEIDYGLPLTERQVLTALRDDRWPKLRYRCTCGNPECGREFGAGHPQARWCSSRCRQIGVAAEAEVAA